MSTWQDWVDLPDEQLLDPETLANKQLEDYLGSIDMSDSPLLKRLEEMSNE